jgi:hypothetical protein
VPAISDPELSRPSGNISLLAEPVCFSGLRLANPVTVTLVPVAKSEGLKPERVRPAIEPNSKPHSSEPPAGFSTCTYSQACGLAQATCFTVPEKTKQRYASKVPPPWCAPTLVTCKDPAATTSLLSCSKNCYSLNHLEDMKRLKMRANIWLAS